MHKCPNTVEYEEARARVRWWWQFVYGDRVVRNWFLLFAAAITLIVVVFFWMAALFGFAG